MDPNNEATAECVFPEDIMTCILTRVPVISIARFKSVCKPWLNLLSTSRFVEMHQGPKNQHFLVLKSNRHWKFTLYLLNADSKQMKKHMALHHPYNTSPYSSIRIVGCCNGLFCIYRGRLIALWNPATNMSKEISPSGFLVRKRASLGFGYDPSVGSDYKVVRMVLEDRREAEDESAAVVGLEVYSAVSDSWTTIDFDYMGSKFSVSTRKLTNDVIVNGNPYWRAKAENGNEFLLGFDVKELLFMILPPFHEEEAEELLFDCDGRLGALVCNVPVGTTLVVSIDVWVLDDGERFWRMDRSYNGVFKACVDRVLQFSKSSGMALGARRNGKVCAFCPETGRDKKFEYAVRRDRILEVYGYKESLAYVGGMEKVKLASGRHFGTNWL